MWPLGLLMPAGSEEDDDGLGVEVLVVSLCSARTDGLWVLVDARY